MSRRLQPVGALVAILTVAATGCAASDTDADPRPSPPVSAAVTSPPPTVSSPTSSPAAAAEAVFPRCEDLIPLDLLRQHFSDDAVLFPDGGGWTIGERLPGPAAVAAVSRAQRAFDCGWGVAGGSDGGVHAGVLQLADDVRDGLVSELRGSDAYTESTVDGAMVFTAEFDMPLATVATGYAFLGSTWIAVVGNGDRSTMQSVYIPAAVDALLAANAR